MKQLTCEMCGSNDLIKNEGMFVCQGCGCKYSVEEAKKMMFGESVEVRGTVKVDGSDELKNLYELARRAKREHNSENAEKYYEMIVLKEPLSWEATFYSVYYKSLNCRIVDISTAANNVSNVVKSALGLIRDTLKETQEKCNAISEIAIKANEISKMLSDAAKNHYENIDECIQANYIMEYLSRTIAAGTIIKTVCDEFVELFSADAEVFPKVCIPVIKKRIDELAEGANIQNYVNAIKKYEPEYEPPKKEKPEPLNLPSNTQNSGGCYVATAVYGSYDCPEVWTLRRYRDYTLDATWYGRAFIMTYYAISPTIVKWFGETEWFKKLWKGKLDKMVAKLQAQGYESTKYNDKY